MHTGTRYVIENRFESDLHSRGMHAPALPKRVRRWSVDGPWLLAWGSDGATAPELPTTPKATFMHWFRREVLRSDAM